LTAIYFTGLAEDAGIAAVADAAMNSSIHLLYLHEMMLNGQTREKDKTKNGEGREEEHFFRSSLHLSGWYVKR